MDFSSLETCTVGKYGNYFGLGSWSLEVIENKSGLCKLDYFFEVEMGYKNFDCQIPTNELKTVDWYSDFPPLSQRLIEQYCSLEKSGNAMNDIAFYWHLVNFVIIASIIGIGISVFFIIRKLKRRKKNK